MTLQVERLWAGWRLRYVTRVDTERESRPCVFCRLPDLPDDESLLVERGAHTYTVLNLYPYNSGHVMVVPYRHVSDIEALTEAEADELMLLTRRATAALKSEYSPEAANLGMNLGRAAGAGLPDHLHMHVLPRWGGDTNYVTVIGGAKVLPEDLPDTWRRVRAALGALSDPPLRRATGG